MRVTAWIVVGGFVTQYTHPHIHRSLLNYLTKTISYDEYKKREQYRWRNELSRWDPFQGQMTFGTLASSRIEKYVTGSRRFDTPQPYEETCDEFVELSQKAGLDPAQHMYDTIKKKWLMLIIQLI